MDAGREEEARRPEREKRPLGARRSCRRARSALGERPLKALSVSDSDADLRDPASVRNDARARGVEHMTLRVARIPQLRQRRGQLPAGRDVPAASAAQRGPVLLVMPNVIVSAESANQLTQAPHDACHEPHLGNPRILRVGRGVTMGRDQHLRISGDHRLQPFPAYEAVIQSCNSAPPAYDAGSRRTTWREPRRWPSIFQVACQEELHVLLPLLERSRQLNRTAARYVPGLEDSCLLIG